MAEDNPGDVDLMREAIKEIGLSVDLEVAIDGAMAVSQLLNTDQRVPDLITLNFNLPKMKGFEVLAVIKQTERLRGVPVVMLTSSDAQTDRLLCQSADAYFVKSGDWNGLLNIVRHLRDLIAATPSIRPTTDVKLAADGFWDQGSRVTPVSP
jgi:CheY-like chemotaxis protein